MLKKFEKVVSWSSSPVEMLEQFVEFKDALTEDELKIATWWLYSELVDNWEEFIWNEYREALKNK